MVESDWEKNTGLCDVDLETPSKSNADSYLAALDAC